MSARVEDQRHQPAAPLAAALDRTSVKAFLALVARIAVLLYSETRRGRPWALLVDNCVLLAAIAWRTNLTHRQLADLFGVGVATVHRILDRLWVVERHTHPR